MSVFQTFCGRLVMSESYYVSLRLIFVFSFFFLYRIIDIKFEVFIDHLIVLRSVDLRLVSVIIRLNSITIKPVFRLLQ